MFMVRLRIQEKEAPPSGLVSTLTIIGTQVEDVSNMFHVSLIMWLMANWTIWIDGHLHLHCVQQSRPSRTGFPADCFRLAKPLNKFLSTNILSITHFNLEPPEQPRHLQVQVSLKI